MVAEEIKKWVQEWVAGFLSTRVFQRANHLQTSKGAGSRGLPIILDPNGKIDTSFLTSTTNAEYIADTAGAMVTGNTETGITVTYQDADNTIDFELSDEYLQDTTGAMVTGNTETGIAVTYDDTNGKLNFDAQTAGDARYAQLAVANTFSQEQGISEADSTVYVATDGTHTSYIALENPSATTGASAGIGFRVDASGATLQRAFFGVVSIAGSAGPSFVWKIRTGASTYLEVLRISLAGLATFAGTIAVGGFVRYTFAAKTIATGVITATSTFTVVDTEGAAAADDLVTINGGVTGNIIVITTASSSRAVTIKDGTGNISSGGDRVLSHVDDTWTGIYNGARWCEMSYANNA